MGNKLILLVFILGNCVSIQISPDLKNIDSKKEVKKIEGKVNNLVNKDYIPDFITNNQSSKELIEYSYLIHYEPTDPSDSIVIFNPLILFGFPIQEHRVIIDAELKSKSITKTLQSKVIVSQYRILYNNPDYTEMRREGLLNIRKNIEQQYQTSIPKEVGLK
jgi:hypothetical protein